MKEDDKTTVTEILYGIGIFIMVAIILFGAVLNILNQ